MTSAPGGSAYVLLEPWTVTVNSQTGLRMEDLENQRGWNVHMKSLCRLQAVAKHSVIGLARKGNPQANATR